MTTTATARPYELGDLVRVVNKDPRWFGLEGRLSSVDRSESVPLVVNLPGAPTGVCFTEDSVELVEAAPALPYAPAVEVELYELYKADGTLREVGGREVCARRRAGDFVVTRTWATEGTAATVVRDLD